MLHDTPVAFFHASACDEGLSIPSVRWRAPVLRYQRLLNVQLPNLEDNVATNSYIVHEIDGASKRNILKGSDQI